MPEALETWSRVQIALMRQIGTRFLNGSTTREIAHELGIDVSLLIGFIREWRTELGLSSETTERSGQHDDGTDRG
jgi:transposase-like protein